VELAKWLLSNHPELLGMKDHHGNTPLIDAVKNDCKLLVDCYLASPGGVNAILVQGSGGDTCLTVALQLKGSRCIRPLLAKSTEEAIALTDRAGNTALHYAATKLFCNKTIMSVMKLMEHKWRLLYYGCAHKPNYIPSGWISIKQRMEEHNLPLARQQRSVATRSSKFLLIRYIDISRLFVG
jgi:hypothetical protein